MNREVHVRICESLVGRFRRATRPPVQVLKEPGRAATTKSQIWVQRASAALHLADRALILDMGQIVFDGTAQEVLDNEDLRHEYLAN